MRLPGARIVSLLSLMGNQERAWTSLSGRWLSSGMGSFGGAEVMYAGAPRLTRSMTMAVAYLDLSHL